MEEGRRTRQCSWCVMVVVKKVSWVGSPHPVPTIRDR